MKKALLLLHYPPPVHGSSVMGKYIKDSEYFNSHFKTRYINLLTSKSIKDIGRNGFRKIFTYLKIISQLINDLLFLKPDIVYFALTAKGIAFYKDVILVFIIKLFRRKIIFHFHNKGVSENQTKRIDNWLYQYVFKESKVILLSQHLYYDIEKYINKNDVYFCPNGIPKLPLTKNMPRRRENTVRILFLSNLLSSKGVYVLLEACKILKSNNINFECVFVGKEGDVMKEDFLEITKKYNIDDCVLYLGPKYGTEKEEVYSNSDIFAFPTYYHNECFPLVLLEAMANKLPIVSTLEGGIPDIVENDETGFMVSQKDVIELANKLELLISNDKLRKQMGVKARERFEDNFTIEAFERCLTSIMSSITEETQ